MVLIILVTVALSGDDWPSYEPSDWSSDTSSRTNSAEPVSANTGGGEAVLPDLESFAAGTLEGFESTSHGDYIVTYGRIPWENYPLVEEYLSLLEEHDFTVTCHDDDDEAELSAFDYDGPGTVETFDLGDELNDLALEMDVTPEEDDGTYFVVFMYNDSLEPEDTGDHYSGTTSSGESGSDAPKVPPFGTFMGASSSTSGSVTDGFIKIVYDEYFEKEHVDAYVSLLTENYDFKLRFDELNSVEYGRKIALDFDGPVDGDFTGNTILDGDMVECSVIINSHKSTSHDYDTVSVYYAKNLNYTDSGDRYSEGSSKPSTTTKPSTAKVASSNKQVPDFGAFAGLSSYDGRTEASTTRKDYKFKPNEKLVNEYIKLLTETFNFEVQEDRNSTSIYRTIVLSYTGTASGLSTFDDGASIKIVYLTGSPNIVRVTYADGLEYTDTGHRTALTVTPVDTGGSSGGGDPPSIQGGSEAPALVSMAGRNNFPSRL